MTKIILLGAGGHARSCIEALEMHSQFEIYGIVGLPEEVGKEILGYTVMATDRDLENLRTKCDFAIVTTGQILTADKRIELFKLGKKYQFSFPSVIAPSAYVSVHSSVGEGTIVMPGALVMPGVRIGRNCIINSKSLIEHDVEVMDNCHISTAAIINGGSVIGEKSFVGSGAILKQGVLVGSEAFVGMGTVLKRNLEAGERYLGE
jgi:sugar O-acyltransferase (sialic acid O-acetyltransferase NeuD family)